MKIIHKRNKILIILLSLMIPNIIFAQEYKYVSILNSGAIWSELYNTPEPRYPDTTVILPSYERFTITGEDTIINEIAYKKLYMFYDSVFNKSKATVIGGIREDENKKVYYKGKTIHPLKPSTIIITNNGGNEGDEVLLYDFGIKIGDTLKIDNLSLSDEIITVSSIDTILIGNTYRKEFSFKVRGYLYPGLKWIEGIGSIKGLIFTSGGTPTNGLNNDLICFKQNNQTLYFNNSYSSCFPDLISNTTKNEIFSDIKVFPNPSSGSIKFIFGNNQIKLLKIIDCYGHTFGNYYIPIQSEYLLSTNKFHSGIYIYKAVGKNGVEYTGKFIVN